MIQIISLKIVVTLTSEKILFIRMGESNMKMLQERGLQHNVPVYIERGA